MRDLFFPLFLIMFSYSTAAQLTIRGTVVDMATGEALANVSINCEKQGTLTDEWGQV
jgi:hypothetical protein